MLVTATTSITTNTITANGGAENGGAGFAGGDIILLSGGGTVATNNLFASGSAANAAAGDGGAGGLIDLQADDLSLGDVVATGGASTAGNGGNGGTLRLSEGLGALNITDIDLGGGAGTANGTAGDLAILTAGAIAQAGGDVIVAGRLGINADGSVTLENAGNAIEVVAANLTTGNFSVATDGTDLSVGTAQDAAGGSISGITLANGNVSLDAGVSTNSVSVDQAVATGGGDFNSAGLDFTGNATITTATGTVSTR